MIIPLDVRRLPKCAVCDKLLDRSEILCDIDTREYRFYAECHGKTYKIDIPTNVMSRMRRDPSGYYEEINKEFLKRGFFENRSANITIKDPKPSDAFYKFTDDVIKDITKQLSIPKSFWKDVSKISVDPQKNLIGSWANSYQQIGGPTPKESTTQKRIRMQQQARDLKAFTNTTLGEPYSDSYFENRRPLNAFRAMRPPCALCGSMVDRFEVFRNIPTSTFIMKAWCHGRAEERAVDDSYLRDIGIRDMRDFVREQRFFVKDAMALLNPSANPGGMFIEKPAPVVSKKIEVNCERTIILE